MQAGNVDRTPLVGSWVEDDVMTPLVTGPVEQDIAPSAATACWRLMYAIILKRIYRSTPSQDEDMERIGLLSPEERELLDAEAPSPRIDASAAEGGPRQSRCCTFSISVAINVDFILLLLVVVVGGMFMRHFYGY